MFIKKSTKNCILNKINKWKASQTYAVNYILMIYLYFAIFIII
jgi:hypothetical protein